MVMEARQFCTHLLFNLIGSNLVVAIQVRGREGDPAVSVARLAYDQSAILFVWIRPAWPVVYHVELTFASASWACQLDLPAVVGPVESMDVAQAVMPDARSESALCFFHDPPLAVTLKVSRAEMASSSVLYRDVLRACQTPDLHSPKSHFPSDSSTHRVSEGCSCGVGLVIKIHSSFLSSSAANPRTTVVRGSAPRHSTLQIPLSVTSFTRPMRQPFR